MFCSMLTSNKHLLSISFQFGCSRMARNSDILVLSVDTPASLKRKVQKGDGVEEHSKPAWAREAHLAKLAAKKPYFILTI